MARFDSAIALAKRLIALNGQDVTLRAFASAAAPDVTKPWRPGAVTAADKTVRAVFLDYDQEYVDGEMIRRGDQRALLASTDTSSAAITPSVDGHVLRGAEVWRIVQVSPLAPNEQTVMFELQVRQ